MSFQWRVCSGKTDGRTLTASAAMGPPLRLVLRGYSLFGKTAAYETKIEGSTLSSYLDA